jgi:hypothetical protein
VCQPTKSHPFKPGTLQRAALPASLLWQFLQYAAVQPRFWSLHAPFYYAAPALVIRCIVAAVKLGNTGVAKKARRVRPPVSPGMATASVSAAAENVKGMSEGKRSLSIVCGG